MSAGLRIQTRWQNLTIQVLNIKSLLPYVAGKRGPQFLGTTPWGAVWEGLNHIAASSNIKDDKGDQPGILDDPLDN